MNFWTLLAFRLQDSNKQKTAKFWDLNTEGDAIKSLDKGKAPGPESFID